MAEVLKGKIDFNGNKGVPCTLEFKEGNINEIVLRLPKNISTSNFYHAIRIEDSLEEVPLNESGKYIE